MSLRKTLTVVSLLLLFALGVGASQQDNGIAAIKTATGYLLVWNQPDIHFTIEVKGREVKPLNSSEHVFMEVDGVIFQVQSVAVKDFFKSPKDGKVDEQSILAAHKEWEAQFIENSLGKKLSVRAVNQKLSGGGQALLWQYDMPEGFNAQAKKQLYLTTVSGDHVLLLNGVVKEAVEEVKVRQLLLETVATLHTSPVPINVRELQDSIRKGTAQ